MSFDRALLQKSNWLLATADYGTQSARPDGIHPRYQWCWSKELIMATPMVDEEGKNRMEYVCACGVDKAVHRPDCNSIIVAAVKFMSVPIDPNLPNCFVLCNWLPPATPERWKDVYGSFQYYPHEGRYIPMWQHTHGPDGVKTLGTINIPYPNVPLEGTTLRVIQMLRDSNENIVGRMEAQDRLRVLAEDRKTRDHTPAHNSAWANARLRLRDKMTMFGDKPGVRGSTSWPSVLPTGTVKVEPPLVQLAS